MLDLHGNLNWDILLRETHQAKPVPVPPGVNYKEYRPIRPIARPVTSYIHMIGITCDHAKPWWWLGGSVSMRLLTTPSSLTEFTAAVEAHTQKLRLNTLNLVRFPDLNVPGYLLYIEIPYYFKQCYIEVWSYSGPTDDAEVVINIGQS